MPDVSGEIKRLRFTLNLLGLEFGHASDVLVAFGKACAKAPFPSPADIRAVRLRYWRIHYGGLRFFFPQWWRWFFWKTK